MGAVFPAGFLILPFIVPNPPHHIARNSRYGTIYEAPQRRYPTPVVKREVNNHLLLLLNSEQSRVEQGSNSVEQGSWQSLLPSKPKRYFTVNFGKHFHQ